MGSDVMHLILDMGQGAIDVFTSIFEMLSLDASTAWNNALAWLDSLTPGVEIGEIIDAILPVANTPLWLFLRYLGEQPLWVLFFGSGLIVYVVYQFVIWIGNVVT